jgi:RNA polymerase sigma-70 factor (ECF subfamily)
LAGPEGPAAGADELELIRAIAAGDKAAFGSLYDRYAGTVMALCLRVLGDRAEAEEAVTDVFWQVWQQAGRFDLERGQPIAWLSTLARTRAIDRRRSLARRRSVVLPEDDGSGSRTERLPSESDPHADAVGAQRGDRVRRALGSLAPEQRRVVELNFFGGLSHQDIAEELGEPLGTIKTRIRTGLARLKESLSAAFEGGVAS